MENEKKNLTFSFKGQIISQTDSQFTNRNTKEQVNFSFVLVRVDGSIYRFSVPYADDKLRDLLKKSVDKEITLTGEFSPSADKASTARVVGAK